MSMYRQFETDPDLEKQGVIVDYSDFRVTLARAGGANRKFTNQLEVRAKPYKRAMQAETIDRNKLDSIVREVFVDTCVLNWEVNQGTAEEPKWVPGIEAPDGTILEFNRDNLLDTFRNLPDLYQDLQEQATKAALYRKHMLEEGAKN